MKTISVPDGQHPVSGSYSSTPKVGKGGQFGATPFRYTQCHARSRRSCTHIQKRYLMRFIPPFPSFSIHVLRRTTSFPSAYQLVEIPTRILESSAYDSRVAVHRLPIDNFLVRSHRHCQSYLLLICYYRYLSYHSKSFQIYAKPHKL